MRRISLIHASYMRPEQSFVTVHQWFKQAKDHTNFECIIALNSDDPSLEKYKQWYSKTHESDIKFITADFSSSVQAINAGASIASGNIFIIVSDDQACFTHWDSTILKVAEGLNDFVIKTDDGLQKSLITMPIFDRAYYNRDKYVYHPEYSHLFCDTEFSAVAYARKRVLLRRKIKFPHNQYSIIGAPADVTAKRNESTYAQGKAVYQAHKANNFGL